MDKADFNSFVLIFDIDGTICPLKEKNEEYIDLIPNKKVVEKLQEYHNLGVKIVLFSSRNMNSYSGNIGLINKNTAPIIIEWLKKWAIPYDEILFGKPWPGFRGFYVDDRSVRPAEFVNNSLEELEMICEKDRRI